MADPCLIVCGQGEPTASRGIWRKAQRLDLQIGDGPEDVHVNLGRLERAVGATAPPIFADALEIAAFIYAADQALTRGGTSGFDYGDRWRRNLRFEIPVRCPTIWRRREIQSALSECLSFLLDDQHIEFGFRADPSLQPFAEYLFDSVDPVGRTDFQEVQLFSGGGDSLCGTIKDVLVDRRKVVLVSHKSVSKVASRQNHLFAAVCGRVADPRQRPSHVAVEINKGKELGRDFTQRSRSFVFASIAALTAKLFGLNHFRFFENGVTSLNLPISPQMIGGRASRTTNPRVLRSFERYFGLLFDGTFRVDNPFQWMTKAEVMRDAKAHGHSDLIARSVSCVKTWQGTSEHPHCGLCSQCVDRRLSALAADLNPYDDPQSGYASDVLTGPREDADRLLIERYSGSALLIRSISSPSRLLQEYPQIAGMIRHLNVLPSEAARRIFDLTRRHADDVHRALAVAVARYSSEITARTLPTNCLLSIACSRQLGVRRTFPPDQPPPATNGHLSSSLEIRHDRFEIGIGAKSCYLKDTLEFHLIAYLSERVGCFVSVQTICDDVWDDPDAEKNSVQRVVSSLRRQLKDSGITEVNLDGSQNGLYRLLVELVPTTNISAASVRTPAPCQ